MIPTGADPARGVTSAGAERALTITELNRSAREILERGLADVWMQGEISRFLAHGSGHWYFTLKDDGACVQAVMFRSSNRLARVRPADGMHVLARGRVSIYEQRGQYQVVLDHLEPAGDGALHVAFERLKQALAAEGLFDAARKRPLPLLPRRIGIATSASGAALADILRVLETRGARVHVVVAPCRVQGDGAAGEIVAALGRLDRLGDLDAIIVGRGGGSIEDLWAFNEESVARAIHAMATPVISAVGHEIDTTISDLVADVRAATPSQAAELVSASAAELSDRVKSAEVRLAHAARHACRDARLRLTRVEPAHVGARLRARAERLAQHVDHLTARLTRSLSQDLRQRCAALAALERRLHPDQLAKVARRRRERLDERGRRLHAVLTRRIASERERVRGLERALMALSPLAVLDRGYAVLQRKDGQVVRAAFEVEDGEALRARLGNGRLSVTVTQREQDAPQG